MSEAGWVVLLIGDTSAVRRDIEAYIPPMGVTITIREDNGHCSVYGQDTELGGKTTMPYPNQIAFLDYLTETEGYKTGEYTFMRGRIIGEHFWTVEDYLAEKAQHD